MEVYYMLCIDAPNIWNDLPDDVHLATSFHSFRKKLSAYLFAQAYPLYYLFFWYLSMALTTTMSQVNDNSFLGVFLFRFFSLGGD